MPLANTMIPRCARDDKGGGKHNGQHPKIDWRMWFILDAGSDTPPLTFQL
jgi:hypothetical protein